MQKLKNRKRITGLAVVFLLTFVMGAAFAFAPGNLEVGGMIGVSPRPDTMCAIWNSAITSGTGATVSTNAARITNGDHTAEWAIGFVQDATDTVTLTLTALNDGSVPINLAAPVFAWDSTYGASGFTYSVDDTAFLASNPLPSGATSGNLVITITPPVGGAVYVPFVPASANLDPDDVWNSQWLLDQLPCNTLNNGEYFLATTFAINIAYTHAPLIIV